MTYKVFTRRHDAFLSVRDMIGNGTINEPEMLHRARLIDEASPTEEVEIGQGDTLTILVEAAGSMRGARAANVTAALMRAGDALEAAGRDFEILAHTTREWKGGRSRKEWLEQGRPKNPGRLNDMLHIHLKRVDDRWADVRSCMACFMVDGFVKENIDGEAVEWAVRRIRDRGGEGGLLVISDGPPIEDSTMSVNPLRTLRDHLAEVLEKNSDVPIRRIHIGHDNKIRGFTEDLEFRWGDQVDIPMGEGPYGAESPLLVREIARASRDLEKRDEASPEFG